MTQAELAEAAGLHRVTVSRIETGAHECTVGTLRRLARALRVRVEYLLGEPRGRRVA